jgi:hypothetical protein
VKSKTLTTYTVNFEFELTSTPITSTAGLAFIGQHLADSKFQRHLASICPHQRKKGRIPDADIAKSMVGLMCVGKPHFDAIAEYRKDPFFRQALGMKKLPSPEILRQRLQAMPEKAGEAFRGFTIRRLAGNAELLSEELHGTDYSVIHVDVAAMDNSDTKKEGVSWTYKGYAGYAPIFAYIGPHGFMLNNELRKGSAHCNCQGTNEWFKQTLKMAERVAPARRLMITDAGHDAGDNLELFDQATEVDFVIKRNMRTDDRVSWLELAQEQTGPGNYEKIDRGARAWYGETELAIPGSEDEEKLRVVFRAINRFARPDGQWLMEPEILVDAYWTSLDWDPVDIQRFYQKRGTSEQFHSELKTDMGVERLPSGKFTANQHLLDLAMIAYNMLRLLGQRSLGSGLVPGRKSKSQRLRLRTVMQNLIYMAGRIVYHARRHFLRIFQGHGWAPAAMAMARGPD